MKEYENAKRFRHGYAYSLQTISYHQLRFLIGYFSVGQMWYVIKKNKWKGKKHNFLMKNKKMPKKYM